MVERVIIPNLSSLFSVFLFLVVGFKCDTTFSIFSAFVKYLIMNKVFFLKKKTKTSDGVGLTEQEDGLKFSCR